MRPSFVRGGRRAAAVVLVLGLLGGCATHQRPDPFESVNRKVFGFNETVDEYVLAPQDSRTLNVSIAGETRFLGAVAGFRDILNAQWRVLVPAPKKGLAVAVERARLVMSPLN